MALERYTIRQIDKKLANDTQIANHYLHTKASCREAFGLYCDERMVGVILYGNPTAPTTQLICSVKCNIMEITRLWIEDTTPKNAESYFIGGTLKRVSGEIIVAFADPEYGHTGVVYQASNFLFLGKSDRKGKVIAIKGSKIHNKTLWKQYGTADKIREAYGDRVYYKEYQTKLRYVFLNVKKYRKKELLEALRYTPMPYPKKVKQLEYKG